MASWPYSTARWARLRAAVLRERPLCEHCRAAGKITPASQVDHVKAIRDGGEPWAWDNLQALCATCHSRKTNAEDGGCFHPARDRRVDPSTGRPMDPSHWWNIPAEQKISQGSDTGTGVGIDARTKRFSEGS